MDIKQLIESIDHLAFSGAMDLQINGLCYDSRQIKTGDLFIAIKGFKADGHLFLKQAIDRGACAFVIDDQKVWNDRTTKEWMENGITGCLVSNSRKALALMADQFYGHPSRNLHLIGVTGTNGKTTTCTLISTILGASGEKVGWVNTLDYRVDHDVLPSERTTPESLDLHRILHQMVNRGCGWAVVEVSSHSLALDRVTGCAFDAAVLTNITQDHLDFHKTLDEYSKSKARLFEMLDNEKEQAFVNKLAVFNMDDPASKKIISSKQTKIPHGSVILTYGIEHKADVMAEDIQDHKEGLLFKVLTPWGIYDIQSPLLGRPNIYNIMAAISTTMGFGIPISDVMEGIKKMTGVPGRFERIRMGQDFDVIIDYAHTEDALSKLLSVVSNYARRKVICVFGCGGDRDKTKRPLMGKAAAIGSDWSIITSDNPRGEDPYSIIREIEKGFLEAGSTEGYEICVDRKDAIYRAINMAESGDMVVITGKGHEKTQIIGSEVIPFDDRKMAENALQDLLTKKVGV